MEDEKIDLPKWKRAKKHQVLKPRSSFPQLCSYRKVPFLCLNSIRSMGYQCYHRGTLRCSICSLAQALFLCNVCVVFRLVVPFGKLLFIHASTNATDTNIPRCLPQILTVPQFGYHLAYSFSCKIVPFDFERAF